ncbi:glycosyltransferase family 39 protein [Deltaproteobacteria bacterium TL4]
MILFSMLPLLVWGLFLSLFYLKSGDWRTSFLSASVMWGVGITVSVELLSLVNFLTLQGLVLFWVSSGVIASYQFRKHYFPNKRPPTLSVLGSGERSQSLILGLIIAIVGITGLVAFVAAPNTWDAMTYHMPRVAHWVQNASIVNFPTPIQRQLFNPPWAEYAIVHFQILAQGDRFANSVQWFSLVGSLIGVSLIARQFGANRRAQIFVMMTAASLPMGILQGSSTQNDYVVAFWVIGFVYYGFLAMSPKGHWSDTFKAASSLGLAILTKGTAYIYVAPFLLWFLVLGIKHWKSALWKQIMLVGIIALCLNLGHYSRTYQLYGSPVGSPYSFSNELYSVPALLSNISKNIGLHLTLPFMGVNQIFEQGFFKFHHGLGVDINDPRLSFYGLKFKIPRLSNHEDLTGNPLHLILIFIAVGLCFVKGSLKNNRALIHFLMMITVGFILFALLLKWQPWHSRLHLPLFVLSSVVVGMAMAEIEFHRFTNLLAVGLLLLSLPWCVFNFSRPLWLTIDKPYYQKTGKTKLITDNIWTLSRAEQYFNNRPELRQKYLKTLHYVREQQCKEIGLVWEGETYEYPLWILLQRPESPQTRLRHIMVDNPSGALYLKQELYTPCLLLSCRDSKEDLKLNGAVYLRDWREEDLTVYRQKL